MSDNFDLVVIGSGPGGYVAAIRAAQLKQKVALVERENLGGICLNWGCIPTKALLRTSEIYRLMQHLDEFGLSASSIKFDIKKIIERSRNIASQLSNGIKHLLKKNKVTVINGHAKLQTNSIIEVEHNNKKSVIKASNIIIATGAKPRNLSNIEIDGKLIWGYREAMTPDIMPKSLLIIGSGAIGVEFASFYNSLGVKVTICEISDRILLAEDEEISAFATKSFEKQGINILTKTHISEIKKNKNSVSAEINHNGKIYNEEFDRVILSVGVVPNTDNIGLENTKIKLENGFIQIDEYMRTCEKTIYAIGDVAGAPCLAHKASHEAIIAAEKISNYSTNPIKKENIPACTYSYPQIASVGLTESKAKFLGYKVKVGKFPFIGNGKAITLGEDQGLIKTIFDEKTGELLGAHMIGAEVTEMIQGYTILKTMEGTELDLVHTIFPHPTLSEMMHESTLNAFERAIHI